MSLGESSSLNETSERFVSEMPGYKDIRKATLLARKRFVSLAVQNNGNLQLSDRLMCPRMGYDTPATAYMHLSYSAGDITRRST